MRQIGSLPDESAGHRLADFLLTLGVRMHVEQERDGQWALWVENDDHLDLARQVLNDFRQNPQDARYIASSSAAERLRTADQRKDKRLRERFVDVRTSWARPAQGNRPVTFTLILLSVLATAAAWWWRHGDWLVGHLVTYWPYILSGQVWRLVTPIFLHANIMHILFNMLMLRDMGSLIEVRRGSLFLATLVLVSAIASNLGQYWWSGIGIGMSGVVYALFGYAWMKDRFQPELNIRLNPDLIVIMIAWLFLCMTGLLGNIGNAAHVTGLLVGMAVGIAPWLWRKLSRR